MSQRFITSLKRAKTEEAVKAAYVHEFKLAFDNPIRADLYCPPVLFEFKYRLDLANRKIQAKVLAQALCYVREIRHGSADLVPPAYVCLSDHNQSVVYSVTPFLSLVDGDFDWQRAPSTPDPKLVAAILSGTLDSQVHNVHTDDGVEEFRVELNRIRNGVAPVCKRLITTKNFEDVYQAWRTELAPFIDADGLNLPMAFIQDACMAVTINPTTGTLFMERTGDKAKVSIPVYERFWSRFQRPPDAKAQAALLAAADRLEVIGKRRYEGKFFTPEPFASLSHDYLAKALGDDWQDEYYVWDPCCGLGNLEIKLKRYDRLFMSTLDKEDVGYLQEENLFPDATIFQFDFLNDPDEKLPARLRELLKTGKVVILMNPPYAEATSGVDGVGHKTGVSHTLVKRQALIGKAGNELFAQFVWRAQRLGPSSVIGFFSTAKHLVAPTFSDFRREVHGRITTGFVFHCKAFSGTKGDWPVLFSVLDSRDETGTLQDGALFEVTNKHGEVVGSKPFLPGALGIHSWFNRPKNVDPAVPLTASIAVAEGKAARLDVLAKGALGYYAATAQDVQHNAVCCLFSGCAGHAHGSSVVPDNYEKALVTLSVRKLIKSTWLNDRDQFSVPHTSPSQEFITDCIVWTLFSGHNQTSSFTAEYKGENRFIDNQFFPFMPALAQTHGPASPGFQKQAARQEATFTAKYLAAQSLSPEAQAVLDAGREAYQVFFANYDNVRRKHWKIENMVPGWYQIRNALSDIGVEEPLNKVKTSVRALADKLRPQVYDYGFLEPEMWFDEVLPDE